MRLVRGGTSRQAPGDSSASMLDSTDDARAAIERTLLTRKTLERLVEFAGQDGAKPAASGKQEETTSKKKTAGRRKQPAGAKEAS